MRWRVSKTMRTARSSVLYVLVLAFLTGVARGEVSRTQGLIAKNTEWENSYYVTESGVEGPTLLVTGGLHGNEPAGYRAADHGSVAPVRPGGTVDDDGDYQQFEQRKTGPQLIAKRICDVLHSKPVGRHKNDYCFFWNSVTNS